MFRADSLTTAHQATGRSGVQHADATYVALRSVFQALQSGLGDGLAVDDVQSHMNEPWNDMVDCLAKTQAQADQKLQRQDVDLRQLGPILPYFWMLLGAMGFDVRSPSLPPATCPPSSGAFQRKAASCNLTSASSP